MLGPLGVDPENPSNEVVSAVVCLDKKETDTSDSDEVSDCATVGLVKKNCATLEKECCIAVHYEGGYATAGTASDEVEAAYKAITAFCG